MASGEFECPVPSAIDDYDRLRRRRGEGMYAPLRKMLLHKCDDACACPVHGTPLFYHPAGDDHACQDVTCEYGHGGMREALVALDRIGMRWLGAFAGQGFEDMAAIVQLAQGETSR
jgi:hypothetical protein